MKTAIIIFFSAILCTHATIVESQTHPQVVKTAFGAQNQSQEGADIFTPIAKYIKTGDSSRLSAWFAESIELFVLESDNNCSRNQARLIMKDFFQKYPPREFEIVHKSGKAPMKYAIGTLQAGGETFRLTLYIRTAENRGEIQQMRIERE